MGWNPNSSQTSTEQPENQQDSEATRRDEGEEVPNELASESIDTSDQERLMSRRTFHHKRNKELSVGHLEHNIL